MSRKKFPKKTFQEKLFLTKTDNFFKKKKNIGTVKKFRNFKQKNFPKNVSPNENFS